MSDPVPSSSSRLWVLFLAAGFGLWSQYGSPAKFSSSAYHHASELTFIWVCLVYAVPGTLITWALMRITKDAGKFPPKSIGWACMAGFCGAGGAWCVILAMKTGVPVYVMALVFGPAQGFNALFTRLIQGPFKTRPNLWFWIGLFGMGVSSWLVQHLKSGASLENMESGIWLAWTMGAAAAWGGYGVCSRLAYMNSAKASGGHGSHYKILLCVCGVYLGFGFATWGLGWTGAWEAISIDRLSVPSGIKFGVLTGVMGFGGAAFVIPANSVKGSPGPIVVMAIGFLFAAGLNAVTAPLWELALLGEAQSYSHWMWPVLGMLAVFGFLFALNSPNRPPKPKASS